MQRPKRVLYIGTYEREYPRNVILIAALRRAGYDVQQIQRSVWAENGDKSALLRSPASLVALGLRLVLAYASLIRGLLRARNSADVVAFGYIGQLDVLVLGPLARLLGKPILFNPLVTLTDTLVEDRGRVTPHRLLGRAIRLVDRVSLRLATSVISDTAQNRDFLVDSFGVSRHRVHVVPVGADDAVFDPKRFETRADHDHYTLRVLFYGNMIPLQGVETIVQAAHILRDERDLSFRIVGTGQTLGSVRALAERLNVNNITFTVRLPYADLPAEIVNADVLLGIFGATSKAERVVPNKVFQAMAMGAAIVNRDSIAARELLRDGESALLVPPADADALAAAIRRLRDPELRYRLGAAARDRYVSQASLSVQASQLDQIMSVMLLDAKPARSQVTA